MKCVCKHCMKIIELEDPKYNSMSDSFWGGLCPECKVYGPMWELNEFIEYRNKLNSVKL